MRFRKRLSRKTSRRKFTRGATRVHRKNFPKRRAMRGGIRV